jgi:hypothetical protein
MSNYAEDSDYEYDFDDEMWETVNREEEWEYYLEQKVDDKERIEDLKRVMN